jgi:hypothetical protein
VGELGVTFDQIVCTGVLHHLPEPDAGLQALREVLAPGGAMHLMLYAPYGRTGVYMLQDFCRRLGIEATENGIRELVTALGALPSGHPLGTLLREAPDFRNEAAVADALLHPQDRAYSVPELFAFLERCGLQFGRWVKQAPYSPHCGLMARLPQAARLAKLPLMDQHAAAELFRGTISRHSVVVYRDDDPATTHSLSFGSDAWRRYVPIRAPDTIAVEERLPSGAAAVLINRRHSHTDIYLPIDAQEKRLYDAVDGARTIGELAEEHGELEAAGPFFQRLARYDQVVFDASASARGLPLESGRTARAPRV